MSLPILPVVYIAGPYTNPDPVENTHRAIRFADELYTLDLCVPVIPHLSLLYHMVAPHDMEFWLEYDMHLLYRCDALYRMPGASSGADKEVIEAVNVLNIPVFYNTLDLKIWSDKWRLFR